MLVKRNKIHVRKRYSSSDKMAKTNILLKSSYLSLYVPQTKAMTRTSLVSMLERYRMVYVKPKNGSLGRGVIRITKSGNLYKAHIERTVSVYTSYESLYRRIMSHTKGETYVVQKGVHTLKRGGRIFDFRVVVQRSPRGGFEVTGIAGRVSQSGRVVSNGGGGGAVGTIDSLLSARQRRIVLPKIESLSIAMMHQVRKRYPGLNEIGIDIAIDGQLKPWIVEFNTRPNHGMFTYLSDKSMIRKIVSYGARYGRSYRLH